MFEFIIYCIGFLIVFGAGIGSRKNKEDDSVIFISSFLWPFFLPILIGAALNGLTCLGRE